MWEHWRTLCVRFWISYPLFSPKREKICKTSGVAFTSFSLGASNSMSNTSFFASVLASALRYSLATFTKIFCLKVVRLLGFHRR